MTTSSPSPERKAQGVEDILTGKTPILFIPSTDSAAARLHWIPDPPLALRAIDDLVYIQSSPPDSSPSPHHRIIVFTAEPPHGAGTVCTPLPTHIALERIFHHTQGIGEVLFNPANIPPEDGARLPTAQQSCEFSAPAAELPPFSLSRSELPRLIGLLTIERKKLVQLGILRGDPKGAHTADTATAIALRSADEALNRNSIFETYALAHHARMTAPSKRAWFLEVWAFTFLGLPDQALALYEEYPYRDEPDSESLLLSGRFRVLLQQFNEGRTILHVLIQKCASAEPGIAAMAYNELARSYIMANEYQRALELAGTSAKVVPTQTEAHLLRGLARKALVIDEKDPHELALARADFERVANEGGLSAGEALFQSGIIAVRLGDLACAELLLRQGLFQRDTLVGRETLIKVLIARGDTAEARAEIELLAPLHVARANSLRDLLDARLQHVPSSKASSTTLQNEGLWDQDTANAIREARALCTAWEIPYLSTTADFALLDEFINRFAPTGAFVHADVNESLRATPLPVVARVFALHLGAILESAAPISGRMLTLEASSPSSSVSLRTSAQVSIPLERFIHDRILEGASADNFSSLESLPLEFCSPESTEQSPIHDSWWPSLKAKEEAILCQDAAWCIGKLCELAHQYQLTLATPGEGLYTRVSELSWPTLDQYPVIDDLINLAFEPAGTVAAPCEEILGQDLERFIVGLGILLGGSISTLLPCSWAHHPEKDGLSLHTPALGRIFPIARIRKRLYLASAVNPGSTLATFAFGIVAAVISTRWAAGIITSRSDAKQLALSLAPSLAAYSDAELDGVVAALTGHGRSAH